MGQSVKFRSLMRSVLAVSAVIALSGAGTAFAHVDVDGHNIETGPNSINRNDYTINDTVDVDLVNVASDTTSVDVNANSGDNVVASNTTVEDGLDTGDIEGELGFSSHLNASGSTGIAGSIMPMHGSVTSESRRTGPNSDNRNTTNITRTIDVDVTNSATVDRDVTIRSNSGRNRVTNNTTVGQVSTGDTSVAIESEVHANTNNASIDLSDLTDTHTDATMSNEESGPNSINRNVLNSTSDVNMTVTNVATVNEDYTVRTDSGNNIIRNNTTVDGVSTGDIGFSISSETHAN